MLYVVWLMYTQTEKVCGFRDREVARGRKSRNNKRMRKKKVNVRKTIVQEEQREERTR